MIRIKVKVIPKASMDRVIDSGEVIKVKCKAIPEKGKANDAVIALLAKHYKVSKSHVSIIRGKTSLNKIVEIT